MINCANSLFRLRDTFRKFGTFEQGCEKGKKFSEVKRNYKT